MNGIERKMRNTATVGKKCVDVETLSVHYFSFESGVDFITAKLYTAICLASITMCLYTLKIVKRRSKTRIVV